MPGIIVKPRSRIFHGHDWVFSSEVRKFYGDPQPGEVITLKDYRDRSLGTAIFDPHSQVVARRISRRKQRLTLEFFQRRIQQAVELRKNTPNINLHVCRLVWSDSDSLPGVIIDRYEKHIVLQVYTLAMYRQLSLITEAITEVLSPSSITLKNDTSLLESKEIERETRILHGTPPASFNVEVNQTLFELNLSRQSQAGLYLDQLHTQASIATYAKGKRVLNAFSGYGGFALACAHAGAESVTTIEHCDETVSTIQKNATLNGVKINTILHNAYDYLKHCEDKYDLIILDPPSFTQNKKTLQDTMRGYKDLHIHSLGLLEKNGILSTHCASLHASHELFLANIVSASVTAQHTLRLLETHDQRQDHPILPSLPETHYLKGYTLQLTPSR